MSDTSTYPLRLPKSIKAAAEKLAREEGVSMNQFVATAVAEKLAAMQTATFFIERRQRADLATFRKLLNRPGGELPREGDER
ncbi:MAG: YlcI/YnfO family protein [Burkholderiales bacterium]|jgi:hypothetical protein